MASILGEPRVFDRYLCNPPPLALPSHAAGPGLLLPGLTLCYCLRSH